MENSSILIVVMVVSLTAGVIHSAIGFGFGIVAISLLPLAIDAKSSHIIVSVCSVPMLLMAAWTYRKGAQVLPLVVASAGAILAIPAGLILFEAASMDLLVRLTGLGVLLMVASSLRPQKKDIRHHPATNSHLPSFVAGVISGFLAGAVSIAGPPIAAYAIRQNWKTNQYKAFVTQFLLVVATAKAILLGFRDHIDTELGIEIGVASILSVVGVAIGERLSRNLQAEKLKHIVAAALITVAFLMLIGGSK
ncbi:MAG: sulfite exporter TauE/SafE family protein [Rubripirellula sp.]